ncbi:MAG: LacI family transcriptional regulator [Lentisphaeria bacterium]|nr:LacI family transcriptional regulator [Lentisphaeria bacterium]
MDEESLSIEDVAEKAGVSPATVSGVLNNSGKQSQKAINAVRQAIEDLGYTPRRNKLRKKNISKNKKNLQIGLLIPDKAASSMQTPLSVSLLSGIQNILHDHDCYLSLLNLKKNGDLPDCITKNKIDGLIIRSSNNINSQQISKIPSVIAFQNRDLISGTDNVMVDNVLCGQLAADFIIGKAAKNVAIIEVDTGNLSLSIRSFICKSLLGDANISNHTIKLEDMPKQDLKNIDAIFIAGHDIEICQVIDLYQQINKAGHIVAVMTQDLAIPEKKLNQHLRIQLDPEKVGMACARQLLWRLKNPTADNMRLLIPPRVLK